MSDNEHSTGRFIKYVEHLGMLGFQNMLVSIDPSDRDTATQIMEGVVTNADKKVTGEELIAETRRQVKQGFTKRVYERTLTEYNVESAKSTFDKKDKSWGPTSVAGAAGAAGAIDPDTRVFSSIESIDAWSADRAGTHIKEVDDSLDDFGHSLRGITKHADDILGMVVSMKEFFSVLQVVIDFEALDTGLDDPADNVGTLFPKPEDIDNSKSDTFDNEDLEDEYEKLAESLKIADFSGMAKNIYPGNLLDLDNTKINIDGRGEYGPKDCITHKSGYKPHVRSNQIDDRAVGDAIVVYHQYISDFIEEVKTYSAEIKSSYENPRPDVADIVNKIGLINSYLLSCVYVAGFIDNLREQMANSTKEFLIEQRDLYEPILERYRDVMDDENHTPANRYRAYSHRFNARVARIGNHALNKYVYRVNINGETYLVMEDNDADELSLIFAEQIYQVPGGQLHDYDYHDRTTGNPRRIDTRDEDLFTDGTNEYYIAPQSTPDPFTGSTTSMANEIDDWGKTIEKLYGEIYKAQLKLGDIIKSYNVHNAVVFAGRFHNRFDSKSYQRDDIDTNYVAHLLDPLPKIRPIPKEHVKWRTILKRYMTGNPMTQQEEEGLVSNIIENHFLKIENGPYGLGVRIAELGAASVALVEGYLPNDDGAGNNPTVYTTLPALTSAQLAVVNPPVSPKRMTIAPILRGIMGDHLQFIRYQMVMWVLQAAYDDKLAYDRAIAGGVVGYVPSEYGRIAKMVSDAQGNQAVSLIAVGKIADEIVTETYKRILLLGTNVYAWKTMFPNQPIDEKNTALTRIFSDTYDFGIMVGSLNAYAARGALGPDYRPIADDTSDYNLFAQNLIADPTQRTMNLAEVQAISAAAGNRDNAALLSRSFRPYEEDVSEQIRRIVNPDIADPDNDICYKVDESVIATLLDYGANPNAKDAARKTPLNYAVLLKDPQLIRELLERGAGVDVTMFQELRSELRSRAASSPLLTLDDYNQRLAKHLVDKFCVKRIPDKALTILPMALYLFDHQLTIMANRYVNNYDVSSLKNLRALLNFPDFDDNVLPISNVDLYGENSIKETIGNNAFYNEQVEILDRKICAENDNLDRLRNQLAQIDSARGGAAGNNPSLDQAHTELTNTVTDLQQHIADLQTQLDNLQSDKESDNDSSDASDAVVNTQNHRVQNYSVRPNRFGVAEIYDEFFRNGLNRARAGDDEAMEYVTYYKMWETYLRTGSQSNDFTQMTRAVESHLANIDSDVSQFTVSQFTEFYGPIRDIFSKIYNKYGEDYFEMSIYLDGANQNYALKQIYNIMCHVFKHTMSIDFINLTAGLLAHRMNMNAETALFTVFETMKRSGFLRYALFDVPKKVVKSVCKISENDRETLGSVEDILGEAFDLLGSSYFDTIDDAQLKKLKSDVTDYYAEYMKTYTAEMHKVLVTQLKTLMRQASLLEIMEIMSARIQS